VQSAWANCLALAADQARLYADAPDETRHQLNLTFYKAFYLDDEPVTVTGTVLKPPFDEIHAANLVYRRQPQVAAASEVGTATVTPITARSGNRQQKAPAGPGLLRSSSRCHSLTSFRSVFRVSVSWWPSRR
jgi:hypothetical protein